MKNSTFILFALLFTFSCQPRDKESETLFSLSLSGLETGINFSQKEISRITRIRVDNEFYLLAAPNNDYLLWYKIKEL